jgi:hypothetical protein
MNICRKQPRKRNFKPYLSPVRHSQTRPYISVISEAALSRTSEPLTHKTSCHTHHTTQHETCILLETETPHTLSENLDYALSVSLSIMSTIVVQKWSTWFNVRLKAWGLSSFLQCIRQNRNCLWTQQVWKSVHIFHMHASEFSVPFAASNSAHEDKTILNASLKIHYCY